MVRNRVSIFWFICFDLNQAIQIERILQMFLFASKAIGLFLWSNTIPIFIARPE